MKKPRRLILTAVAATLVALAAVPAAASATTTIQPGSMTFAARQVATQSDPQTATVVVNCTVPGVGFCNVNDLFIFNPQLTGSNPGDFSVTNVSCPAALPNNGLAPSVCQFFVRFAPTAPGARQATLTAGTSTVPAASHVIALTGTAVAAPPTGQRAEALKKCKKKKTKKKRKKCRKRANELPL